MLGDLLFALGLFMVFGDFQGQIGPRVEFHSGTKTLQFLRR